MSASRRMTAFTRLGFAARGLLFIVIALLVLSGGGRQDPSGALGKLHEARGGSLLLIAMAAGFCAYGLWRLADAAFDIDHHDPGARGLGQRIAAAGSGAIYIAFAWRTLAIAIQGKAGSGVGATQAARTALALPAGPLLLAAGGAVLVGAGVGQMAMAYRCTFCDRLDPAIARRAWVRWMGRGGYAARGVIFIVSGFFIAAAGVHSRASEAGGMREALRWLDSPVDLAVAAGLFLFGLFSLIEARFRLIPDVPFEKMAEAIRPEPIGG